MATKITPACCRRSNPIPHVWAFYPADTRYEYCVTCGRAHRAPWYAHLQPDERECQDKWREQFLQLELWGEGRPEFDLSTIEGKRRLARKMRGKAA